LGGAFVLLTTAPDQRRPTRMQIKIQPQDEEEATLMLASNVRHLATADVPAPKVITPTPLIHPLNIVSICPLCACNLKFTIVLSQRLNYR